MARPRIATELHRLRGNPSEHRARIARDEPTGPVASLEPPADLTDAERALWQIYAGAAAGLGTLLEGDQRELLKAIKLELHGWAQLESEKVTAKAHGLASLAKATEILRGFGIGGAAARTRIALAPKRAESKWAGLIHRPRSA